MLDMVDVTQQVKIVSLIGKRYPLADTAAGQVLLAFDNSRTTTGLDGQPSISSEQVAKVQKQGYCIDAEALGEDIASIAAPVLGKGGKIYAALCLVGPTYRMPEDILKERMLQPLTEACKIISSKLGWHSGYSSRRYI